MLDSLKAWWRALRHLNDWASIYLYANILWLVLSLPIITAPAAWAGLIKMSHRAYTEPTANLGDFWSGFRENLTRGIALAALNALIVFVNVANLLSYRNATGLYDVLRPLWILVVVVWFTIQFYMWPLFYEMKEPSLLGAFKNACVMLLLNPLFTIGCWLGILIIAVISSVLVAPWALVTGSALAAFSTSAVLNRLEASGLRPPVQEMTDGIYDVEP